LPQAGVPLSNHMHGMLLTHNREVVMGQWGR
jgi:hypothetical protein